MALTDMALAELKAQKTIRIFMAQAPGTGHQGATVALMQRLRDLGFSGTFDVIYDDTHGGDDLSNPQKLESLLPGFKAGGDAIQNIEPLGLDVQVMSLSTFQGNRNPLPAKHGFTGGLDNTKKPEGILKKLEVDFFVQLQPLNWVDGKRGVAYQDENGDEQFHEMEELAELGYIYDVTRPDIEKELGTAGAENKIAGVKKFLEKSEDKSAHTMLVYGMGTSTGKGGDVFGLFHLAKGMMYAQDHASDKTDLGQKGVIIGAAGWKDEDGKESQTLTKMLNGEWNGGLRYLFESDPQRDDEEGEAQARKDQLDQMEQENRPEAVKRLKSNLLKDDERPRATVVDIGDPNAAESIGNVQPGEVLIVKLGRLPLSVFEYMRVQTTLPNGFESVNGMDKERQNKTYFHVGKELSNKFPEELEGMDATEAAAIAEQNRRVGRQFQGNDSIGMWKRNYDLKNRRQETLRAVKDADFELTSPRTKDNKAKMKLTFVNDMEVKGKVGRETISLPPRGITALFNNNRSNIENEFRKEDPDKVIGDFMNETRDSDSALNRYFERLKARSKDKDQVAIAWEKLIELEKQKSDPNALPGTITGDAGDDGNVDVTSSLLEQSAAPATLPSTGYTHIPSAGKGRSSTLPLGSSYASGSGTRRSRSPSPAKR
jgi:hypothetical protein